ncbi:MAG: transglycosylase SLT domain-containing protein, partial [Pyrinomonadaceae bacterium]
GTDRTGEIVLFEQRCVFWGSGGGGPIGGGIGPGDPIGGGPQKPGQIDIPGETERLFQDCLKIVEAHLKEQLANTIRDNNRSNQPLALLIAHAAVESTLGTALVGLGGELGLFQLKPSTARGLGLEKFTNKQLRDDFALNTRLGTTYLQQQVNAFGGDVRSGLGAYKQGAKSVRENGLTPRSQIYADAIQKCAKSIQR